MTATDDPMTHNITATPRTTADVAADMHNRQARQATLRSRLDALSNQIEKLDEASARALAEGTEDITGSADRQNLASERDRIARALSLLDNDVARLHAERQSLAAAEAAEEEARCFTVAVERAEALEARLRDVLATEILPLAAGLDAALAASRRAESDVQRLHGRTMGNVHLLSRATAITEDRLPLFALLAQCRLYVERTGVLPAG